MSDKTSKGEGITMDENSEIEITDEIEAALERLFVDAKAATDNPLHKGRFVTDIQDDIDFLRAELDIEL